MRPASHATDTAWSHSRCHWAGGALSELEGGVDGRGGGGGGSGGGGSGGGLPSSGLPLPDEVVRVAQRLALHEQQRGGGGGAGGELSVLDRLAMAHKARLSSGARGSFDGGGGGGGSGGTYGSYGGGTSDALRSILTAYAESPGTADTYDDLTAGAAVPDCARAVQWRLHTPWGGGRVAAEDDGYTGQLALIEWTPMRPRLAPKGPR